MLVCAAYWLSEFCVLFGLWFVFVGQFSWQETLVGAGAAALAATAAEVVRGAEHPRFWPHIRWVLEFWRLPAQIVHDCWLLTVKLFGIVFTGDRHTGNFVSIPFHARGNDAAAVARRALATFYTTLPPNAIVIGIDQRRDVMLVHTLQAGGKAQVLRDLERS